MKTIKLTTYTLPLALLALAACSGGEADSPAPEADSRQVVMEFAVNAAPDSRAVAQYQNPDLPLETLKSVRIIIVDPAGTVEATEYTDIASANGADRTIHRFKVRKNETKRVYIIANEGSTAGNIGIGSSGGAFTGIVDYDFAARVKVGSPLPADLPDLVMSLAAGQEILHRIPMSAVYDIEVGTEDVHRSFSLHRAAVKFDVTFTNSSSAPVTLSSLTLGAKGMADSQYLFPRVKDLGGVTVPQVYTVALDGTVTENATMAPPVLVDDSYTVHYRENLVNPEGVRFSVFNRPLSLTLAPGTKSDAAVFYQLEGVPASAAVPRPYSVGIVVNGAYVEAPLPNLDSLPRNTHAVIRITLSDSGMEAAAQVIPYKPVDLRPVMGVNP